MRRRLGTDRFETASDDEVVLACRDGDERAWDELIDRYAAYIYAVAGRAFGLAGVAAAEVFQDSCIRIYLGLAGYTGRGDFRAWLRAVIRSACLEHVRQTARHPVLEAEPPDEAALENHLDDVEAALDLRAAVQGLGEPCRTTIKLHFFADLTQAEVARRLGSPEGTIAARISRCLRRLRDGMQGDEPEGPSR
jgi:RNA polymerase sigma-70 factor, ECF subfamily